MIPQDAKQSKSQTAYEYLKRMILSGQLAPRDDVSEKNLQERLGFSRTPIREAIKRLEEERFVRTYPQKGTFVEDVTIETVHNIYETRLLIEPYLTRQAIDTVSFEWLGDMLKRLRDYPPMEWAEESCYLTSLDTELHTTIASYSTNLFFSRMMQNLYEHDSRIRLKTRADARQVRFSRMEHIGIVEAMLRRDYDLTERREREHILNSRDLTYRSLGFTASVSGELEQRLNAV